MTIGLGLLRLPPAQFWAMTPRELAAAMAVMAPATATPPTRAELAAMMGALPDGPPRARSTTMETEDG